MELKHVFLLMHQLFGTIAFIVLSNHADETTENLITEANNSHQMRL